MTMIDHYGPRALRRIEEGQASGAYTRLTVQPLAPTIGAEVSGVDLRGPFDDALVAELRQAMLEWKVLFFRDQHLTGDEHRAFALLWGELEVHPFLRQGEVPEVVRFEKGADEPGLENNWHSDVTWREVPSFGSVLRAVDVPDVGGDTLWADMAAAYDGLPAEVKARVDGLHAVHDFTHTFGTAMTEEQLHGAQGAVRERRVHVAHRRAAVGGVRVVARAPLAPGVGAGVPVPVPVERRVGRLVGQPDDAALREQRLLPGATGDGAGDDHRRSPGVRAGVVGEEDGPDQG